MILWADGLVVTDAQIKRNIAERHDLILGEIVPGHVRGIRPSSGAWRDVFGLVEDVFIDAARFRGGRRDANRIPRRLLFTPCGDRRHHDIAAISGIARDGEFPGRRSPTSRQVRAPLQGLAAPPKNPTRADRQSKYCQKIAFADSLTPPPVAPQLARDHRSVKQAIVPRRGNDGNTPLTTSRHSTSVEPDTRSAAGYTDCSGRITVRYFSVRRNACKRILVAEDDSDDAAAGSQNPARREIRGYRGGRRPRGAGKKSKDEIRPDAAGRLDAEDERARRAGGLRGKKARPKVIVITSDDTPGTLLAAVREQAHITIWRNPSNGRR